MVFCKVGLETFLISIRFFYRHFSLVIISLIPSIIRAYQMLNPGTLVWLEGIVWIARGFLVLLIIRILPNRKINQLNDKHVWDKLCKACSIQLKRNWPYGFFAQIIAFFILLFGFGNLLIMFISWLFASIVALTDDSDTVYQACVFFLKNVSIIPLKIVYFLNVCGLIPKSD